jgi:hypothetical protein
MEENGKTDEIATHKLNSVQVDCKVYPSQNKRGNFQA